jgi:molybdate transport system substrate-binding protein
MIVGLTLLSGMATLFANPARADELKLFSLGAGSGFLKQIIPDFERVSGHKVIAWFGPSADIREMMRRGDEADFLVLNDTAWNELIESKTVTGGVKIARTGVGVGIRKGALKPNIATPDELKKVLLGNSVGGAAFRVGTIGIQIRHGFERLGIADQVVPKYHAYPNGTEIVKGIVSGEIEIGMDVIPVMAGTPNIDFLGPFPPGVQENTEIYAVVPPHTLHQAGASALLDFLKRPESATAIKANFLEPLQ